MGKYRYWLEELKLRKEREEGRKITWKEIAQAAGVAPLTISRIIKGVHDPSPETAKKLAKYFGVPWSYIIDGPEPETPPSPPDKGAPTQEMPKDAITSRFYKIPIVGKVRAGEPSYAQEDIEEWIEFPEFFGAKPGRFILRVTGDSMSGAGIEEGMYILVAPDLWPNNGDIVVAMVNHEEATCKYYHESNGRVILVSANPKYPPIEVKDPEARIVGVVVWYGRRLR